MTKSLKKNIFIGSLLVLIVIMSIAYAAFMTNININGSANVTGSWCIGFDSTYQSVTPTTAITGTTLPSGNVTYSGLTCSNNYKTNVTLDTVLNQPGDKVVYTLKIANKGSLPAAIESINIDGISTTTNKTIVKGNIVYYITMPENTVLDKDGETTMKISAEFQNLSNIGSGYVGEKQSIEVIINAVQSTGSNGMVVTPEKFNGNGTIYRISSQQLAINDSIESLVEGVDYTTDSSKVITDDMFILSKIYLKHNVSNYKVTESYACYVSDKEHCLQGGSVDFYTTNRSILEHEENKNWFKSISNNTNPCIEHKEGYRCYSGIMIVTTYLNGSSVGDAGYYNCYVTSGGDSFCEVE